MGIFLSGLIIGIVVSCIVSILGRMVWDKVKGANVEWCPVCGRLDFKGNLQEVWSGYYPCGDKAERLQKIYVHTTCIEGSRFDRRKKEPTKYKRV